MDRKIVLFDDKINCCGCWACYNICPKNSISMLADSHGFLFPQIDDSKCIKCGMCLKVCPIKKKRTEEKTETQKPHIKIVNFGTFDNFGAVIAAACLENTVRTLVPENYIVQTVNYNSTAERWNKLTKFRAKMSARFEFLDLSLRKLNLKKSAPKNRIESERPASSGIRMHRYKKFRNNYLNLTVKSDNYDLDRMNDNDVALICGSDVIWFAPRIMMRSYKGFYLSFGKKDAKRIAYAASIDSAANFKLWKKWLIYKYRLKNFDAISIRENENLKFVQSLTANKVQKCVDPVFLLEPVYFENIIADSEEKTPEEDYIYAYILMNNDKAYEYTLKLAKEKNLKIYYFADFYNDFGDNSVNCYTDGPAEFLQRIKNAKYVITTSFHCIVFSLIYKKQFIAFDRGNNSIKIPDILETFGIPERLAKGDDVKNIDEQIDFDDIENKINAFREQSMDYLRNALKNI